VKLFHRILDTAVKQRVSETQVTKESESHEGTSDDDDDDDDDFYNNDDDIDDINQIQQAPLPQPQPIQPAPQVPARDLLAQEIFGRQLRSRGPVQQQELPKRPLEYKKYTKK
jgi:hypothetical protein